MKKQIGYVPQEDLLRDNISLKNTLDYIGKLRLPTDVSKQERLQKIDSVLEMLNLDSSLKNSKIRKLSGGQRKRVSIASELISDPPLLFLDEPTSGLDPETETDLMYQLRDLSHNGGKTLVVITHTIQNIMLFDMVLFFGPGGKLCYAGGPGQAMAEFGSTSAGASLGDILGAALAKKAKKASKKDTEAAEKPAKKKTTKKAKADKADKAEETKAAE